VLYYFEIYHLESGKHRVDQLTPLTEADKRNEYDMFPAYLESCLRSSRIKCKCEPAKEPIDGLLVTIESDEGEDFIKKKIDEWIVRYNQARLGLCLVANLT
jgi:hypothetical protein